MSSPIISGDQLLCLNSTHPDSLGCLHSSLTSISKFSIAILLSPTFDFLLYHRDGLTFVAVCQVTFCMGFSYQFVYFQHRFFAYYRYWYLKK
ncbi:hypothetical protein EVA_06644 [gut metagenome]|uniref:Uncharacterized protein n=1 Tax=gut metagenome TaxID=749906 RepID=J9GEC1_9ZZZZ